MTSLPKTYKCIVVKKAHGDFEVEERPMPSLNRGEVLVKTLACGVCHSDCFVKDGLMPVPYPVVPGHEIVGDVAAVGEDEKKWQVGDRVGAGWEGGHCFRCQNCRRGDYVTCENGTVTGIFKDGGYAEYVVCNTESIAAVPRELDPAEAGPLLCAGITTFNSIRNVQHLRPGDTVAVQGIGGLGHLAIMFARRMGYKVVALSSSESKRDLAINKLGAHEYLSGDKQVDGLVKMGGANLIICTANSAESISPLTKGLATGGTILILAGGAGDVPFNTLDLLMKKACVQGWPSGSAIDSEDTLNFAAREGVKCHIERYDGRDLEQVKKAYSSMMDGSARFRSVLTFN
ncbi:protein of unknown function [Taphrina deformans PYCC 5710]|uniref:Enoyl reductase (ER) domain-containing protein n=1 Tax=Taphrina deformans (strain PYCC 5710 / ATCC 11124 / CBS 356.35 / IMI 108563 / JCM 9778 / NBRC 8474) TaxID=1097556 RepID=R4XDN4_TAPDE|nr:protein of unknown function [Taphrina deformans PYCC 5710]|eukprot:CCG83722.1 protein of unknown function [Taphrina deformans PYCC 5710]